LHEFQLGDPGLERTFAVEGSAVDDCQKLGLLAHKLMVEGVVVVAHGRYYGSGEPESSDHFANLDLDDPVLHHAQQVTLVESLGAEQVTKLRINRDQTNLVGAVDAVKVILGLVLNLHFDRDSPIAGSRVSDGTAYTDREHADDEGDVRDAAVAQHEVLERVVGGHGVIVGTESQCQAKLVRRVSIRYEDMDSLCLRITSSIFFHFQPLSIMWS